MVGFGEHFYRVGTTTFSTTTVPADSGEFDRFLSEHRRKIEPWLSAVCQSEHLNLLIGSGLTIAAANIAGATATDMGKVVFDSTIDSYINDHAAKSAASMGRGEANIEDQFRSALAVADGLDVTDPTDAKELRKKIEVQLRLFLESLFASETAIKGAVSGKLEEMETILQSFLLSFANRTASRDRLHVFTTNYDRLIEYGCDLAGIRTIDRFVGALNPVFRSSRLDVDYHYNPPGIRGEPRFMEGVIRLTKLHGSLDWHLDRSRRQIYRSGVPFAPGPGAGGIPANPLDTVMIYPNPAKDFETTYYPYAELFRDFAAAICRPNAVVFTYGYGFGDDHVNRVLLDMLSIPSTHLVVTARSDSERLRSFLGKAREAQISILLGKHFSDLATLTHHYLPKPALDFISNRMTELLKRRPEAIQSTDEGSK